MKRYKATVHFNKHSVRTTGCPWSIHYRGKCHLVKSINWSVNAKTEWKPDRKTNPRAFITAMVKELIIDDNGMATLK